jgi:pimeloyl-ACP methyl ester carboxylesterase
MAAQDPNRRNVLAAALTALTPLCARAAAPAEPYEVEGGQFASFDGVQLFYRRVGAGPAAILLHGLLGDGPRTWFSTGVAQRLAEAGFTAIAPDARAHGLSAAPASPAAYPKDVQAMDVEALMRFLGLRSARLVGYGLGAQTAVRLMVRGAAVERAVLAGAGERLILQTAHMAAVYEDAIRHGRSGPEPTLGVTVQAAIRLQRLSPAALVALVRSEVPTPRDALARIRTPVLAVTGRLDRGVGAPERLAALFPDAQAAYTMGAHLQALRDPPFSELVAGFLTARGSASRFELPAS